jgi:hypothetical protein
LGSGARDTAGGERDARGGRLAGTDRAASRTERSATNFDTRAGTCGNGASANVNTRRIRASGAQRQMTD